MGSDVVMCVELERALNREQRMHAQSVNLKAEVAEFKKSQSMEHGVETQPWFYISIWSLDDSMG